MTALSETQTEVKAASHKDDVLSAEVWQARFEDVFSDIAKTRMADVPILNHALSVKALGFQKVAFGNHSMTIGALITPWFLNLIAISDDEADLATHGQAVTETVALGLPGGAFDFLVSDEPALGRYAACSLFSPMFEFKDQETVIAVAEASLAEVLNSETAHEAGDEEAAISAMWHGEKSMDDLRPEEPVRTQKAPNRRALLTGRLAEPRAEDDHGEVSL